MDLIITNGELPNNSDKVLLPPNVLSTILDKHGEDLPHPLIFNLKHGEILCFVGVKQFSAAPDTISLPNTILNKLGVKLGDIIEVELSYDIPKGTSLSLKPLQFYQEINNWKYYLESNLTKYYTVLNKHEKLIINNYEFIVEDCNADTISIIDTDISLDIIPLNDIMAQQQLNFNFDKSIEIKLGELVNNENLLPFNVDPNVQLYKLDLMNIESDIEFIISTKHDIVNIDLLIGFDKIVNLENFQYCTMDQDVKDVKNIIIPIDTIKEIKNKCQYDIDQGFDNDEISKWLYIVPFAWEFTSDMSLEVKPAIDQKVNVTNDNDNVEENGSGIQCKNCGKFIDGNKLVLHEAFCFKNNIKCECGEIFLRSIPHDHYHCPICRSTAKSPLFKFKHEKFNHQVFTCKNCNDDTQYDNYINFIELHKPQCPETLHECKFCHLILPQGEATYVDKFENLTNHENNCGNKTDECFKCSKLIKRKDLRKHLKLHELDTKHSNEMFKINFNKCSNENCTNLITSSTNDLNLCEVCYGPLYSSIIDANNLKLQMRIERRYMLQLNKGCSYANCQNIYCKKNTTIPFQGIKDMMKLINDELLLNISLPPLPINQSRTPKPNKFWFCVNEGMNNKRLLYQTFHDYPSELVIKGLNEIKDVDSNSLSSWLTSHT